MSQAKQLKEIKTVGIISKKNTSKHEQIIRRVYKLVSDRGFKVVIDAHCAPVLGLNDSGKTRTEILKQVDLVVVLGGDGTLLNVVHSLPKRVVYVLSVNTGTLGFMSEVEADRSIEVLERTLEGKFVLDRRSVLRVTAYDDKNKKLHTHLALNEAVISQGAKARLIELPVEINQRQVNRFQADGLIIATPTGSTGHSLSAGGPIVHPSVEGLIITPICPLSLTNRPIVIPNNRQIKVTVETFRDQHERVMLTIDGQVSVPLCYGAQIKIRRSSRKLYLVRMSSGNYYRKLRSKLRWG